MRPWLNKGIAYIEYETAEDAKKKITSAQARDEIAAQEKVKNSTQGRQKPTEKKIWPISISERRQKKVTITQKKIATQEEVTLAQTEKQVEVPEVATKKRTRLSTILAKTAISLTSQAQERFLLQQLRLLPLMILFDCKLITT